MTAREHFELTPRDYALELVDGDVISARDLLICALKYMSHNEVRDMLACNELAPDSAETGL